MRRFARKWLGRLALVSGVLLLGLIGYYTSRVIAARRVTPERIGAALSSGQMELEPSDLNGQHLQILLAVQDPHFFSHRGTDFSGGTMTTITQALVKIYYFDRFRPGIRKIEQSLIARFAMDDLVTKDDQLRLFLNTAYMGNIEGREVHGFSDAAWAYFGKSFEELERSEFIALIAMLSGPNRFDPIRHPEASARRVEQIERLLTGECGRGGLFGGGDCWEGE